MIININYIGENTEKFDLLYEQVSKYHNDSFTSFYSTYYDVRMISDEALEKFVAWVKNRRNEFRRYHSDN